MKIGIDNKRCQGHALCANYISALVDYDDEGYAMVITDPVVPESLEDAARIAASACPEQAISLTD